MDPDRIHRDDAPGRLSARPPGLSHHRRDRLFIAVAPTSPKRLDLRRDGRFALHALPGKWRPGPNGDTVGDDEFYMTGRARLVRDEETRRLVAESANHVVRADDWLFELGIERTMTAYWEKVGQPDTYAVRRFWPRPT